MSRTCYIPTTIDSEIAIKLGWNPQTKQGEFNPYRIATLRGMYDDEHPNKHIDTSNVETAAQELASYRQHLKSKVAKEIHSAGTNLVKSYRQLRAAFTSEEQFNRVTMISTMISQLLDNVQRMNPGVSRTQLLEGYESNGRKVGGQMAFFEKVYEALLDRQSQYMALPNGQGKEKADKITKVLENWGALTTYVRIRLRDTEGIKLNNKEDFMSEANLDNLDDNRLSELLDISESKKEAWQDANDMKSAFGNIGSKVRSVISMIPRCSRNANGSITVERDDLGCEKMLDPVRVHQQLLDLLRGMTNSIDMMNRLAKMSQTQAWIEPLFRYLQANPQVKTQFFVDFKKNFQKYSIIQRDTNNERNGVRRYKTIVLNRVRDKLSSVFNMRITGSPLTNDSVYDSKGNINWANLRKVRQTILDWLDVKEPENSKKGIFGSQVKTYNGGRNKYFTAGGTSQQRRDFIVNTSRALGIDIDADTANSLMNDRNKKDLNAYLRNLYELVQYGIDPSVGTADLERLLKGENLGERLYRSMVKNSGKSIRFREKIDKLNTLITKHREGLRVDSRVVRKDSKGNSVSLFSNVNPSYMGDKLELITSYIEANDKKGLKQFLEQEYLSSSFFMNDGKILNRWLRDLYEACNSNKSLEDFAGIFDYQRFLGTPDFDFENFTPKQHAIDMIYEYFSDSQISPNATTAMYPVFILGNSGISKYIRQKRYTEDEIVDGFYDAYLQEIQRRKAVSSVNQKLDDLGHRQNGYVKSVNGEETFVDGRGYSKIENFSDTGEKFTMLKFLNKDKYKLGDNPTEQDVKNIIKRYLDDSYKDFLRKLNRLGVFETRESNENVNGKVEKVKRYTYLDQILSGKDPNKVMSDFYRNVKFATIQQLQLMTIDPAFYKGTKNLQKVYKGIHSPGIILDIYAKDFNGQLYSQDGTETCIYFEDIEVSADQEFLDVIAATYGITFDEEGNPIGKNAEIYKKYTENTLTDGQGYRTLTSYRKVLGMAGQWTREMENAYNQIMTLRETYGKNAIPTEELRKIEELAVIFKPLKPFMFTHEYLPINSNDSQIIPVEHKYAEAVLIPELLPQGSKLKDIAYYMEENNVDLLGSTKICKVGCFGTTSIDHLDQYDSEIIDRRKAQGDNNTDVSNTERLNFAMSQAFVHKLSYSDYRIQTNIPDHVYNPQLFGTQTRKLVMAGVIKYDEYGNLIDPKDASGHYKYEHYVDNQKVNLGGKEGMVRLNGRNLIAFYNSLIVANELKSYQKFEESIKSKKGLSDRLIQSVISNSREPIDNLLSFGLNESGDFSVPLFEGGLEHDTAALLFSMYKKLVNKQTINGGSAVQASAMGIKDYSEDGGLRYVTDGKNNILYAECEIPFNLSYRDQNDNVISLDYDTYCNEDGTLKMKNEKPLLEWDFPGITSMIAYRIPTERDYSMINLKVVRFSRKTAGGTIKVPVQGTTIAGFDFDADKLYFMRKEFVATEDNDEAVNKLLNDIMGSKSIEWKKYDLSKPPMENDRAAINNMLIHLIQQRLMDPETLEQRTTPGGFANASKAARILRELLFGSLEGIVSKGSEVTTVTSKINIGNEQFYDGLITKDDDSIFVFGSNAASFNGNPSRGTGGAALSALQQGRIEQFENMANTFSKSGKAYGIQTVTKPGARNSLTREEIISNIKKMYQAAIANPDKKFKVAYTNVGNQTSLNGYSGNQMIDMFIEAGPIPANVMFSRVWQQTGKFNQTSTLKASNVTKVISGGQTGVDTIGLQVARELGIVTGGTAPRSYLRESGVDTEDIRSYGLREITEEEQAEYTRLTGKRDPYTARTSKNVENSDGTVYFASDGDPAGRLATQREANRLGKPFLLNPTANQLREWLIANNIQTLNVAGNRGSKLTEEQTQNIFNILREALGVKNMSSNSITSINFEELERRAKDKESDPEPDYDPSDPMTIIIYNQQNQVAGKLIGIFANHNTNHAFASLMKKFRIKRGSEIEFAGHTILDGYGFDLLHGPKGVDVALNLAEFLAASVDAVKDPVLNFLNFNTLTADSGAFLARIGYNTMEIGLLFNQPIIKEVCEYAFNNGLNLDDAIRDITKQYSQKFGLKEVDTIDSNVTSTDAMAKNIVDYRQDSQKMDTMEFVSNQLQLLKLFKKVSSLASEVSQFVTSTKFTASNAVGSTFGDMYAQQMKVNNYITRLNSDDASSIEIELTDFPVSDCSPIKGEESRLNMTPEEYASDVIYNPLAYEQTMYDLNRKALRAMSKYYPYETPMYRNIRMTMMNLTRGKYLDGDTINSIHRDLMTYLLAQQERSDFNGEITKHTEHGDMSTREYYTKYFAKDLFTFLQNNPEFKGMPIFEYLMFEADNEGTVSMNIQGIGGLAPYQKDAIRDSWTELNRTEPLIARDLFLYNFYKLGFDFSPLTFMNLAPTEIKQTLLVPSEDNPTRTYVDFLNQILKGDFDVSHNEFAKQYILNHPDNYRLVYQANSKEAKKILRPLAFEAGEAKSRFTLDVSSNKDAASMFVLSSDKKNGIMHFVPAIQIGDSVFIANGTSSDFNMSTTGTMEYIRMDTLGSNKSKNYHSEGFSTGKTSTMMAFEDASTGSTSITADEAPQVETPSFDRQGLINSMAKELLDAMKRIGEDSLEDGSPMTIKFIEDMILNPLSNEDLLDQAELIKKACRENGVIMLDENGEPMQGC